MKISRCTYACCLLFPAFLMGQDKTSDAPRKNELSAGVNYQSALHYFGRTDSLQSSGLFPTVGFQSSTGLYVQGNFIFVNNKSLPLTYTGTTVEAGYRFPESAHFSGNLFFTKFLYKDKSTLVQSALSSQTGINLNFLNKIANINTGLDLKFSNQTDLGATLGLDHLFLIKTGVPGTAFAIDPSAYLYLGTQEFSTTYLAKRNILGIPVSPNTTESVKQFNILSYELSVPVVFVSGKFNASVTPAFTIPQNLVTVAGRPDLSERGKNLFYITLGIGVKL